LSWAQILRCAQDDSLWRLARFKTLSVSDLVLVLELEVPLPAVVVLKKGHTIMYEPTSMISVGTSLLGRIINSKGEPVDGKGLLAGTTLLSLVSLTPGTEKQPVPNKMFETGIKVIDLLAPMAHGGISSIFADTGVGKQVILEEIMQHTTSRNSKSAMICLSMDESSYETSELMEIIHEGGLESHMVMVFEQTTNSPTVAQRVVQVGLTVAAHFQAQGYTTLLLADRQVTTHGELIGLDAFSRKIAQQAVATILLGTGDDYTRYQQNGVLSKLDEYLLCDRELFKRRIYPAIDPLQSASRLLDEGLVSSNHKRVAQQTRQLLQRYYELRATIEIHGESGLPSEDLQVFRRGQRIEQFLTQPFVVAEPYTDIPGEYIRLDDIIRSFEALLSGQYDDVPEKSFWMVGTIEQAIAKG
jgi:F-type H+-transporting ATPase subunit beta